MGASSRTPEQVVNTVQSAFEAVWTGAGESLSTVAWENLTFSTSNLDDYVICDFAHASGSIAALGTGTEVMNRREAIFAAQIFVRHNTGRTRGFALSEICLDFLESARLTGIRFRNIGLTEAGRVNEWYQFNVNAQVQYDSFRTV